jgi:hypothetical protein
MWEASSVTSTPSTPTGLTTPLDDAVYFDENDKSDALGEAVFADLVPCDAKCDRDDTEAEMASLAIISRRSSNNETTFCC